MVSIRVIALIFLLPLQAKASGAELFARLKTLVGSWEARTETGGSVRVSYRLVSGDSVLVQSYGSPSGKETLTVFYADGERLLATHYCAQGNQPRLVLDATSTSVRLVFGFMDATNLRSGAASHLVRLEMRLEDDAHYTSVETYEEAGKRELTTLQFRRVQR